MRVEIKNVLTLCFFAAGCAFIVAGRSRRHFQGRRETLPDIGPYLNRQILNWLKYPLDLDEDIPKNCRRSVNLSPRKSRLANSAKPSFGYPIVLWQLTARRQTQVLVDVDSATFSPKACRIADKNS
jgi:hypothetical protein